jgi:sucrase/ferredoxin-like protein
MPNVSSGGVEAREAAPTGVPRGGVEAREAAPAGVPGCAVATRLLGATPAGTATHMTAWLLIEQPGPWPADALDHALASAFPAGRPDALTATGLRPLLIRRPGRARTQDGRAPRSVFVGSGAPGSRWLERLDYADLAGLDLDAVASGRPGHGEPVPGPLFLVCTHGAKDMCCALLGRPLAAALAQNHPDHTWEVSHVGGDRWAGNLLVVPDGFLYGQLEPAEANLIAKAAVHGQVEPGQLRGRTSAATRWTQYAEIALRQHTGLRGLDDVLATSERPLSPADPDAWVVTVRGGQRDYDVTVRRTRPERDTESRCTERIVHSGFRTETIRPLVPGP